MTYKNFRSYFHTIIVVSEMALRVAIFIDGILPESITESK